MIDLAAIRLRKRIGTFGVLDIFLAAVFDLEFNLHYHITSGGGYSLRHLELCED